MSLSLLARKAGLFGVLAVGLTGTLLGQNNYVTNGSEYAIAGFLPGDQARPWLSISTNGGFLVWEDNVTDGDGPGISAQKLDGSLSGAYSSFRVNQAGAGLQENPQVTLLKNGGAAFVWQGGQPTNQHIYARFLSPTNTWLTTNDVQVNGVTSTAQVNPAMATLAGGNVIIVWSSLNQQSATSLQDVYGQILTPSGQKVGGEFLINQFTAFNQRSPSVAALANGGFIVAWVSEQQRSGGVDRSDPKYYYSTTDRPSVDIFARLFNADGTSTRSEFLVNAAYDVCANPRVAADAAGGFMIAWSQRSSQVPAYGWDVYARPFSSAGVGGTVRCVNTQLAGDQFAPQISALNTTYLVVWTSLGQDGSREGVYGQFVRADATAIDREFRVNSTTINQQKFPAVNADGNGRFLVAWSSYVGNGTSFDLFAQRYVNVSQPLLPMNAPFVHVPFVVSNGLYQPQIQVSWPEQAGLAIDRYLVYVDGSPSATASISTNVWVMTAAEGLTVNSTHSFRVAYITQDGRSSPLSAPASATTWIGQSYGGVLPVEWVAQAYGWGNPWPGATAALVPGGPSLLQVFLTGGNPLDPNSWLRVRLLTSPQGQFLSWNAQPGLIYQVQASTDLGSWSNLGGARFAADSVDSVYVGNGKAAYYRVLRLR